MFSYCEKSAKRMDFASGENHPRGYLHDELLKVNKSKFKIGVV